MKKNRNEINDLYVEFPKKRNELITAWEEYSENNGVIFDPLDVNAILKH